MFRDLLLSGFAALLAVAPLAAQSVEPDAPDCLPVEENAALTATADGASAGSEVRLYFRRLNPIGSFYWVEMHASATGYWTTFPKPEDREQPDLTDEWWETLQDRDWMEGRDRDWLEQWLEDQDYEAAEYYTALFDSSGELVARSDIALVEVRDEDDCPVTLDAKQTGWAMNLTVGETAPEQAGEEVFHWLCDGIVTRVDSNGIYRADEFCRACVIGAFWPTAAVVAGVVSGAIIDHDPPGPATEIQP